MAKRRKHKRRTRGAASPGSPKRVSAAAKQIQAMQLREAHVSYEMIAERLGYANRSGAYKAVMAGLKAARNEPAKALRRMEVRRLDRLSLQLWAQATGKVPDYAAIDRLLKIMQRRAALLGLDINKLALTNPTGEKEFSGGLTDAERILGLRALVEKWRRSQAANGSSPQGEGDTTVDPATGPADPGAPLPNE